MKWSFQDKKFMAKKRRRERAARNLVSSEHWRNTASNSTGCHPKQVETFRQFFKDMGVGGVTVNNNGTFSFASRNSMLNAVKAQRFYNDDELR